MSLIHGSPSLALLGQQAGFDVDQQLQLSLQQVRRQKHFKCTSMELSRYGLHLPTEKGEQLQKERQLPRTHTLKRQKEYQGLELQLPFFR